MKRHKLKPEETFFWTDYFSLRQKEGLSPDWELDSIAELIGEIGRTVPCR